MAIIIDKNKKLFTLHTKDSTYQMQAAAYGFFLHLYYGPRIDESDLGYLIQRQDRGFSGNPHEAAQDRTFSTDTLPQEFSVYGTGDYRESCLELIDELGARMVDLRYDSYSVYCGKHKLEGLPASFGGEDYVETLDILLRDTTGKIAVRLSYSVFCEENVITRSAKIINTGHMPVTLTSALSFCLDFCVPLDYDWITLYGRHCQERNVERRPLRHEKIRIESNRGASSHQQNPFAILCEHNADLHTGICYGMALVYSGSFVLQAERDQIDQVRIVGGIQPKGFSWQLQPDTSFQTPEVLLCCGDRGINGVSQCMHALLNNHVIRGPYRLKPRPIILNSWESVYFNFDETKLHRLIDSAAELDVDLFVLDDGWFGRRDDDTSSLGDWVVNCEKLPHGLSALSGYAASRGMNLGLWVEPEMVSENSDLYRLHPDWTLGAPNRSSVLSRSQLILDLTRKEVRDYLFDAIASVMREANVAYVKWDMNRHIANAFSNTLMPEHQGELMHRYMLGLYELLERFVTAFPNVLFESCSGGGGRFDAGMLYYTPQIWTSDNTDALDRIDIQTGTAYVYPVSSMSSHVSACPNHQTGRKSPLSTRATVASTGAFGYELDPTMLSEEERCTIRQQIKEYRANAELLIEGRYYLLANEAHGKGYECWMIVSPSQDAALVTFVRTRVYANAPEICVRLCGLNPEASYQNSLNALILSGTVLMNAGFVMPCLIGELPSVQIRFKMN